MGSSSTTDPQSTGDCVSTRRKWSDGPTLLVIDGQTGLRSPEYGPRGNASCLPNIARLLQAWTGSQGRGVTAASIARPSSGPR